MYNHPEVNADHDYDAIVVGAGFAGLYMLHRLRQLGLRVRVLEAGDGIGGTWFWNRYPGARCDIESFDYSYSFSPELEQEWVWTERYPSQREILAYLNHVADRFDLRRDIQLRARVVEIVFDDESARWHLRTAAGERFCAQFCVMATGGLSAPKDPDIPALDRFAGELYRTSAWPTEGVDLAGKRVGIIGTGSSAVQAIPELAEQAGELFVFQRTPCFSLPARNAPLDPEMVRRTKAEYSARRARARASALGLDVAEGTRRALEVSDAERRREYDKRWSVGGGAFLLAFSDLLTDPEANETAAAYFREQIQARVRDPALARVLTPTDYPVGARRLCLDTNYYETFNRDNVTLIDLRSAPIEGFTADGITTADAHYPLDVVVLAIGFDALSGALLGAGVRGRAGVSLAQRWAEGPVSYLGLQVAGLPNLFTLAGPGSPSIVVNVVAAIEQHVDWIARCIEHLRDHDLALIEASAEAEAAWTEHVREVAWMTLFPQADSYYVGTNIAGKPRVFSAYLGGLAAYAEHCERVIDNDYEGFVMSPAPTPART